MDLSPCARDSVEAVFLFELTVPFFLTISSYPFLSLLFNDDGLLSLSLFILLALPPLPLQGGPLGPHFWPEVGWSLRRLIRPRICSPQARTPQKSTSASFLESRCPRC